MRGGGEITFYTGNHPGAQGNLDDTKGEVGTNATEQKLYMAMGERAYFDLLGERAMSFVREHPKEYVRLVARRAVVFWLGDPWRTREWKGSLHIGVSLLRLKQAYYVLPTLLAVAGLVVALRRREQVWPLTVQVLIYSVPYLLIFCTMNRYRAPIEGSLILLGSVALRGAWGMLRRVERQPVVLAPARLPRGRP